jgi:hypothetical protein
MALEAPKARLKCVANARAHLLIILLAMLRCTAANGSNRPEAGITHVAKAAGAESAQRSHPPLDGKNALGVLFLELYCAFHSASHVHKQASSGMFESCP